MRASPVAPRRSAHLVTGCLGVLGAAAILFAGTNIDDALVLTVLNVAARSTGSPAVRHIWAGQFLGTGVLVTVSWLAAAALHTAAATWAGWLGLVPLLQGIRLLITAFRDRGAGDRTVVTTGLLSVVGTTLSAGGDNLAAYTAAFRLMSAPSLALTVGVFLAGTGLWCLAGHLLLAHERLVAGLRGTAAWLVPPLYIALGLYLLRAAGLMGS